MTPQRYNFSIVRGTTEPFVIRLKRKGTDGNLVPIAFDDVRLTLMAKSNLLVRASVADGGLTVTDPSQAEITWIPAPDQSRLIPLGPKATYEIEVRAGSSQRVYLMGTITGLGGGNDD